MQITHYVYVCIFWCCQISISNYKLVCDNSLYISILIFLSLSHGNA